MSSKLLRIPKKDKSRHRKIVDTIVSARKSGIALSEEEIETKINDTGLCFDYLVLDALKTILRRIGRT